MFFIILQEEEEAKRKIDKAEAENEVELEALNQAQQFPKKKQNTNVEYLNLFPLQDGEPKVAVVSSVKGEGETEGDEIIIAILGSYMITEERVTLEVKEEEGRRRRKISCHIRGKRRGNCWLAACSALFCISREKSRELWGFASEVKARDLPTL